MTAPVEFEVIGIPGKQGDKSLMKRGGKTWMAEGNSKTGRELTKNWRSAVGEAARDVAKDVGEMDGPLEVTVEFRYPMAASRRKADRERGWCWKVSAPDIDKLARSTFDALTQSGLIHDDARIVNTHCTKREVVGWTGALISIRSADD